MQYGYLHKVGASSRGLESGSFKYPLLQGLLSIVCHLVSPHELDRFPYLLCSSIFVSVWSSPRVWGRPHQDISDPWATNYIWEWRKFSTQNHTYTHMHTTGVTESQVRNISRGLRISTGKLPEALARAGKRMKKVKKQKSSARMKQF